MVRLEGIDARRVRSATIGVRAIVLFVLSAAIASSGGTAHAAPPAVSSAAPAQDAAIDLQIAGPVLMVADLERSLRFYIAGLGMEVGSRLPGNPGPGATVNAPGAAQSPFILLRQRGREARSAQPVTIGDGLSRIMLSAANAKAAEDRLKSAGYAPTVPNGRNVFFCPSSEHLAQIAA